MKLHDTTIAPWKY